MNQNIIETKGLTKQYGSLMVVKNLNIAVHRGEIFGLLGPNGAGKTTTISILTCLLEPSEGSAMVAGYGIGISPKAVKQRIGLVPQELALYPTLSARDNLRYFGGIYGLHGKSLRERIDQVLEMVGLTDRGSSAVKTLSGGMKRRLNIAAGLLHNPEILFLDEPTVGVDPQSRNAIFNYIERLRDENMTIIYTTHYMEEAERLCDRVAIIDEGRIIALDTPQKLIEKLGGKTVQVLESNLETVFLHLTGKHLRG